MMPAFDKSALRPQPLTAPENNLLPGADHEKQFKLVKYFSTISVVVIFLASLTLAAVISREAERIITARVEADTVMLMNNLNYQMHTRFLLPTYIAYGEIRLRDKDRRDDLQRVIDDTKHGFDVNEVLVYDDGGRVVYSTLEEDIGEFAQDMDAYLEAIRLYSLRRYIRFDPQWSGQDLEAQPGDADEDSRILRAQTAHVREGGSHLIGGLFPSGTYVLKSYKAMEDFSRPGGISGVLQITRDLTPEYKAIARFQLFALIFAVFASVFLIFVLRKVVARGESIINARNAEREALKEQLNQAERLAGLGSMVATVAHEIRNPLGIIHSTADLLKKQVAENPRQARLAGAIVEESDRLSVVVTEFLDFARPQLPRLASLVVEDILEELLAFLEVTLTREGIEVKTAFRPAPEAIMADGGMLHRAFLNLMVNAVQVMPDGGLLTVETADIVDSGGQRGVEVIIADTGPGLSEDDMARTLQPFYTTKAKGTGLGLVIVNNIIAAHNGRLDFISPARAQTQADDGEGGGPGLMVVIQLPANSQK